MLAEETLAEKIEQIQAEMRREGLWNPQQPKWVNHFGLGEGLSEAKFSEWLQFIYFPNLLRKAQGRESLLLKENVTPQALTFLGDRLKRGRLLQLLIELDALV